MSASPLENTGLRVNLQKTKLLVVQSSRHTVPTMHYDSHEVEVVDSYKYLGVEFCKNTLWEQCITKRVTAGWRALYAMQNNCFRAEIHDWPRKAHLFRALVEPVLLYGSEVWGPAISASAWESLERVQKSFLTYSLGVKTTVPYAILLQETGFWPLQHSAMKRHLHYIHKVHHMDDDRYPVLALAMAESPQRLKRCWKEHCTAWFARWFVSPEHCLVLASSAPELLQQYLHGRFSQKIWDVATLAQVKTGHYHAHINPTLAPGPQAYLLASLSRKKLVAIASIRTGSHRLRIETGRWERPQLPREARLCECCQLQVIEDESHTLLSCPAFEMVRNRFLTLAFHSTLTQLLRAPSVHDLALYILEVLDERLQLLSPQ